MLSCHCCRINIICIRRNISAHLVTHSLTHTHVVAVRKKEGVVSDGVSSGDRGTQEEEIGTTGGIPNVRRAGATATGAAAAEAAAVAEAPWRKLPSNSARPRTSQRPPPRSRGRRRKRRSKREIDPGIAGARYGCSIAGGRAGGAYILTSIFPIIPVVFLLTGSATLQTLCMIGWNAITHV